jgi:hypothetical protein
LSLDSIDTLIKQLHPLKTEEQDKISEIGGQIRRLIENAAILIKDGQRIRINGSAGYVEPL